MDNISKSSAHESSDSAIEKFMLPNKNAKRRMGVRSVPRGRIEDNQDSYNKSESENESFIHKINEVSNVSSPLMLGSQTDIDAGYNTEERNEIKQVPNFLAKTYEIVNVSSHLIKKHTLI